MYSIRIIFTLIIIFVPIFIYLLAPKEKLLKIILYVIVIYLLIYKIAEYYYHLVIEKNNQYPVEFSAVSYFLISIAVLTRWKGLREFASFLATLGGFFYAVANIVAPESFLHNTRFYLEMARLNHTLLFIAGLITNTIYFNRGYKYPYIIGIILVIIHAFIAKSIFNYSDTSYVIYEVVLATFLKDINLVYKFIKIIYYPLAIIVYLLLVKLFIRMNDKYYIS